MDVLELLLGTEDKQVLPTKEIKLKRLSELCGADVVFKLRAISYNAVAEIKERNSVDMPLHIMLEGVTEPKLSAPELLKKFCAATPIDMLKKLLLPGEIEDISRQIEILSGYRTATIEDIKKK